jgi:integrase
MASKSLSTDRSIASAKARNGKPADYSITYAPGLRIRVMESGFKTSSLIYSGAAGKARVKLGEYPHMSLKAAKAEAGRIRAAIFDGEDPAAGRKLAKAEAATAHAKAASALTFRELSARYLERHAKTNKKSWEGDAIQLNATILPALGHMPADKITRRDIIGVLDAKAFGADGTGGFPIAANRAQALISTIFSWAVGEDLVPDNPAHGIKRRGKEVKRERTLTTTEMKRFWFGIEGASMTPAARDVLRLALICGQRISEIAGAEASEFDFGRRLWTIPSQRCKNKVAHDVPLAPMACAMFEAAFARNGTCYAFASPARRFEVRPITRGAVTAAWGLARKKLNLDGVHVHDLRRSFATGLGDPPIEADDFDIGLCLNHQGARSKITGGHYNKAKYEQKKRRLFEAWEAQLSAILEGRELETNVIVLRA